MDRRESTSTTILVVVLVLLGFFVLTGLTTETECVVDGICEFGIPLRWSHAGNTVGTALIFALDLALFLSLVPATLAVLRSRSGLGLAYLVLVGVLLGAFTAAHWSGKLGLRITWHSLF